MKTVPIFGPHGVAVKVVRVITPAFLRGALERRITERYYPNRAESIIDAHITAAGLAGSGYDPTWIERRREERARRARGGAR